MLQLIKNKLQMTSPFLKPMMNLALATVFIGIILMGNIYIEKLWHGRTLVLATAASSIANVITLFLLFNTVYYGFVTNRKLKMLIIASGYLGAGIFQLLRFIGLMSESWDNGLETVYFSGIISDLSWVILFGIILYAELFHGNKQVTSQRRHLLKIVPLLMTISFFCLVVILWFVVQYSNLSNLAVHSRILSSYIVGFEQIFLIILAGKSFYTESNNHYIAMISSYIFFFYGASINMIYYQGGLLSQLEMNIFMLFGFASMLSSVYQTHIGDPMRLLQHQENQLTLYAKNLEKVINKRTTEVKVINERFNSELDYAKSIQQSLLPEKKFMIKNVHFITEYFPCDRLSGDFYDIYRIDEDNIGMYILDVSGHGISAALMTMFSNNFIKSTEKLIMRFRGLKPHKNLAHFFEEFNKMNFPDEMYMVVFFASYNMANRTLTYCSGGMNSIPFVIGQDGEIEYLDQSEGFAICKLDDLFTPEYKSASIQLKPGDRVVFYTDGVTDKEKNRVFDQEDFEKFLIQNNQLSLKLLNEKLVSTIYPYTGKLEDDITYFIFEI